MTGFEMKAILFFLCFIVAPISLSIYATLGVFYPALRGHWRGSHQPMGQLSAIGNAMCFDGAVLVILGALWLPPRLMDHLVPVLILCSLLGFGLVVIGYFRDHANLP